MRIVSFPISVPLYNSQDIKVYPVGSRHLPCFLDKPGTRDGVLIFLLALSRTSCVLFCCHAHSFWHPMAIQRESDQGFCRQPSSFPMEQHFTWRFIPQGRLWMLSVIIGLWLMPVCVHFVTAKTLHSAAEENSRNKIEESCDDGYKSYGVIWSE